MRKCSTHLTTEVRGKEFFAASESTLAMVSSIKLDRVKKMFAVSCVKSANMF